MGSVLRATLTALILVSVSELGGESSAVAAEREGRTGDQPGAGVSGEAKTGVAERRIVARRLAKQGDAAFRVGRCDKAIPLWQKADRAFHAPTISLRIARCQALLGHVVDATKTLTQIVSEPHPSEESDAFRLAREQARKELPGVRARIGRLRVIVDRRGLDVQPRVFVDLERVAQHVLPRPIDPGKHQVRVQVEGQVWETVVVVEEGKTSTVRVALSKTVPVRPPRTQRTVGMILGGVGLASLGVGAYFAASASTLARTLDGECGRDRKQCPPDREDDIQRLRMHATLADVTLGGGAALFAAGAVVVLTEKPPPVEPGKIVFFPVGLGAGVRGVF